MEDRLRQPRKKTRVVEAVRSRVCQTRADHEDEVTIVLGPLELYCPFSLNRYRGQRTHVGFDQPVLLGEILQLQP